jgi:hypothetical protein
MFLCARSQERIQHAGDLFALLQECGKPVGRQIAEAGGQFRLNLHLKQRATSVAQKNREALIGNSSMPSAILLGTESAALRSWPVSPNIS